VIYLLIVSIIWGFSFVLIKGMLVSLDSNFVSLIRMSLSFLLFLPFLRANCIIRSDRLRLMLIGGVQFGFMYVAYVASYHYLPAHVIALMTTTTPLFVTLFNDLFRRRLHGAFFLTALIAVAGGAIIQYPAQHLSASLYGVFLVQVSNAAFAFGQIAYKRLMDSRKLQHDREVFGFTYGGAVLVTGAFSTATIHIHDIRVNTVQWLALAYLGAIASGLCFFMWNRGARKVNEGTLATMNNLKIPLGVIASLIILGESTDYVKLLAGSALFGMALLLNKGCSTNSGLGSQAGGGELET
jgi:drug/metabolite transporter (DMT)-like permease